MVIETWSPKETFAVGERLGKEAKAGEILSRRRSFECFKRAQ